MLLVETVSPREDCRQLIGGEVEEIGCYAFGRNGQSSRG